MSRAKRLRVRKSLKRLDWEKLFCGVRMRSSETSYNPEEIKLRNEFDKDYERIIYSSSIRRLQDKAQVFPLQENDFTRTRLTHSLEVASLGRSMAWTIAEKISKNIDYDKASFDTISKMKRLSSLVEVACLVHDLGNPPFGHYGEDIIKNWFDKWFNKDISRVNDGVVEAIKGYEQAKEEFQKFQTFKKRENTINEITEVQRQDFLKFDGNAQTIRILTKLQFLNDKYGANFSYGTLATLMKYPCSSAEARKSKFGYLWSEKDVFNKIQNMVGIGPHRHPATFIVEAADDIAYLTADIEDAVKKGIVSWGELDKEFSLLDMLGGNIKHTQYENLVKKIEKAKSNESSELDLVIFQNYKVIVQGLFIEKAIEVFMQNYNAIMSGKFEGNLIETSSAKVLVKTLKKIAYKKCFVDKEVVSLELVGDKVISDLLSLFVDAVLKVDDDSAGKSKEEKLVQLISSNFKYVHKIQKCSEGEFKLCKFGQLDMYERILMVTDFISGMSDSYAVNLHRKLIGVKI